MWRQTPPIRRLLGADGNRFTRRCDPLCSPPPPPLWDTRGVLVDHSPPVTVFAPPHQTICPQEGRGDVATSDLVPFYWGPSRRQGTCSQSAHFWAPGKADVATSDFVPFYWGHPRRQGSNNQGNFFHFEVGGHDGADKGRIHVSAPFIGRKKGTLIA